MNSKYGFHCDQEKYQKKFNRFEVDNNDTLITTIINIFLLYHIHKYSHKEPQFFTLFNLNIVRLISKQFFILCI